MQSVGEFTDLARLLPEVQFLLVYIEEAHPVDGWYDFTSYSIHQHRSLPERLAACQQLFAALEPLAPLPPNLHFMVDPINNAANIAYGANPERLYILQGGQVRYRGGVGPFEYHLSEVRDWLHQNR
jgi:hypothetical protein